MIPQEELSELVVTLAKTAKGIAEADDPNLVN